MPNRLETYKGIISWVNNTFVPFGLKPIEDLPKAIPGVGDSCVIAQAITDGLGDKIDSVHVGLSQVTINFSSINEMKEFDSRYDVGSFILAYDDLKFPDLIDADKTFSRGVDHDYGNRIAEALEEYDDGKGVTTWYEDIPEQYSVKAKLHLADMNNMDIAEMYKEQESNG